jgi:hypothetical protein
MDINKRRVHDHWSAGSSLLMRLYWEAENVRAVHIKTTPRLCADGTESRQPKCMMIQLNVYGQKQPASSYACVYCLRAPLAEISPRRINRLKVTCSFIHDQGTGEQECRSQTSQRQHKSSVSFWMGDRQRKCSVQILILGTRFIWLLVSAGSLQKMRILNSKEVLILKFVAI